MKRQDRLKWIAIFDLEPLISSILTWCLVTSLILMLAGIVAIKIIHPQVGFGSNIMALSLPALLAADLKHAGAPEYLPSILIHLGLCVLFLMPYLRLMTSFFYFLIIERDWKHALFTGLVTLMLTVGLFTQLI